jgi:hypothetical protein
MAAGSSGRSPGTRRRCTFAGSCPRCSSSPWPRESCSLGRLPAASYSP